MATKIKWYVSGKINTTGHYKDEEMPKTWDKSVMTKANDTAAAQASNRTGVAEGWRSLWPNMYQPLVEREVI